jgi:hypothetical protein
VILAAIMAASMISPISYHRPSLAEYQLEALFHAERYGLIEASTKSGKTHGAMAWLSERAFTRGAPGRNFWWVAPVYPQAEIAYRRLSMAIDRRLRQTHDTKMTISLPNGSVIWFKSGEKPDNLYGEDVYDAVIDEASRLRQESWHALRTTVTQTGGQVRIIGNVKGRRNWFYDICRKAEAGEPGMKYKKIRAADAVAAGILKQADIEDAKKVLPEQVYRELFEAEPSDDGGNPFGISAIAACVRDGLAEGPAVAFGVDLAKSVDWTVIIGLNAAGEVCVFERMQKPWSETIEKIKATVAGAPALVDSTGVGDPILESLQKNGGMNFEGYKFSADSKQRLMEGLAVAIQRGDIKYPSGTIPLELESFEYEYTRTGVHYEAAQGCHDDAVCALALAVSRLYGPQKPRLRGIA